MNKLPLARQNNIVVQELGEEVLIYDLDTHKAYNLNGTSSIIYNACDGVTSFEELKRKHKFTDDLIYLALDQLREENLISEQQENYFGTLSRREAIRKVGLTTMIAIPVITSLVAPQAVDAQSSGVCTPGALCTCTVGNASGVNQLCANGLGGTSNCPAVKGCDCSVITGLNTGTCINF